MVLLPLFLVLPSPPHQKLLYRRMKQKLSPKSGGVEMGASSVTALFQKHIHPLVLLLFLLLSLSCFTDLRCRAQKLVQDEVETLKVIGSKLNKRWNFSVEPCSGAPGWLEQEDPESNFANNVTCTCSNTTSKICHVTAILLKGQNLIGVLPDEFASLTFLTVLDLSRNYLNGTIPAKWGSLPLIHLSLLGNQISGNIPAELGKITTLQNLTLEDNLLQGPIPPALGNVRNLTRLLLSANNLSGPIPESLGNLKKLEQFRIDGNPISDKIPSFMGNWTKLKRLDMQGTSLEGPFPRIFSTLKSINELRVSDWKGGDGKFPALENMTKMKELVLRNLSISGEIPDYIGRMSKLKVLDLSFNNFTGAIPRNFDALSQSINYMFLTNNKLSGTIPDWIWRSKEHLDLSYNSFTGFAPPSCGQGSMNFVSSFSSTNDNSVATCFRKNLPCSGKAKNYKLFINCGGNKVTVDGDDYQDDSSQQGPSTYQESPTWAYSSTGEFVGNQQRAPFVATNASLLNMSNPELYMTARLSPLSLKYYGLCLQKGNYTVDLHFAEIMFTDDQTYSSVGRRLFDVSIQWAGKGTNSIPQRGVYGPLISAISVKPNFTPDLDESKLSTGAIAGIVVASFVILVLIFIAIWFFFFRKNPRNNELRGLELQTGYFTLKQIKAATKNFDPQNKIGEGGFGSVYKGVLPDGSVIAVKQLSSKSKQGNREFINEIGMISALQHPNLVKLYGCCIEGNQLLLIYEYMENNSLARALFGLEKNHLKLDWQKRLKICIGIARGLAYLHEESRLKIVHRDIKATNVLLDKDLNAKISDFGLAKLDEEENTHISTRIAGTVGYMAPEYAMRGYLTDKADVYSFGVVVLEIVSGISNTNYRPKEEFVYLLDWAYVLQEQDSLLDLVDESLGLNYSKEEALQMLNLALVCTNPSPTLRPTMSTVVSMLEGKTPVKVPTVNKTASKAVDARFKALEKLSHDSHSKSFSMDGPWTDSSASAPSEKNLHVLTSHTLIDITE